MNPYFAMNFWEFFLVLFQRIGLAFSDKISLATDEVQCIVVLFFSIACSLLGSFFFLKKSLMVINSLSHTVLFGISITAIVLRFLGQSMEVNAILTMQHMLFAAFVTSMLTIGLTHLWTKKFSLQEDASIGFVFTFLFSLGLILITLISRNTHIGVEVIMGNMDLLHVHDIFVAFKLFLAALLFSLFFYFPMKISSFQPSFAKVTKIDTFLFRCISLLISSWIVVMGFRVIGVVALLGLFMIPPMIVRSHVKSFFGLLLGSCLVSCLAGLISIALSRHILSIHHVSVSTGGLLVTILAGMLMISLLLHPRKGIVFAVQTWQRRRLENQKG